MNENNHDRGCGKYEVWVTSPVGGLEAPTSLRVHLTRCDDCRNDQARLSQGADRIGELLDGAGLPELPENSRRQILASLPTPAWQFRSFRTWILPSATFGALVISSLSLLDPIPAGLAERSGLLSLLTRPLSTIGEMARILSRGASVARAGSEAAFGSGLVHVAPVAALLAALSLVLFIRQLRPRARVPGSRRS